MTEYIDKAELYEKIAELEEYTRSTLTQLSRDNPLAPKYRVQLLELGRFKHFVADFPSSDVKEIVHGEWKTDRFGMERSVCSICNSVYEGGDHWRYCPMCGAKMN